MDGMNECEYGALVDIKRSYTKDEAACVNTMGITTT
jgi:hypothetical protein